MDVSDFLEQHLDDNGDLPPQQAAEMMRLAQQGDTATADGQGSAPATASEEHAAQGVKGDASDAGSPEEDPSKTVILALDGKHTIPYERLSETRQQRDEWKDKAQAALSELERVKAQVAGATATATATAATDAQVAVAQEAIAAGVDPKLFGDFDADGIAQGVQKLFAAQAQQSLLPQIERMVREEIGRAVSPLQQRAALDAAAQHRHAVLARHPDAVSIVESTQLQQWMGTQPSYVQAAMQQVVNEGSAAQVCELLDAFKLATAPKEEVTKIQGAAESAKQAAAKVARPPATLSDIPGGKAMGASPDERMAALEGVELMNAMLGRTPEQIDAYLNRNI